MKLRTLVFSGCGTRIIGHTGFLKCIEQNFDLSELYDLKKDPKEKNNLYYNPIYKDSINYLKEKILDWQEKVNDELTL